MANKPFTSKCTNVYNETTYNTIPNAFGLHNVTATQAHDRTVCDTISTCIASNLQPHMQMAYSTNCCDFNKSHVSYAQPQLTQRGVTFTFNPAPVPQCHNLQSFSSGGPPNYFQQMQQADQQPCYQPCQQPLTLQQQIALRQLEQQGLELMLIQEHLQKNPYKVQFHYNGQTSTTDLLCGQSQVLHSGGMPDLKNALAALAELKRDIASLGIDKLPPNCPPNSLYSELYKAKTLILTKSPDILNKEKTELSNSGITNKDSQCQSQNDKISSEETANTSKKNLCDVKKPQRQCKKPKKSKKKPAKNKRKSRHSNPESSESLFDDDSDDSEEYYDDFDDDDYYESDQ